MPFLYDASQFTKENFLRSKYLELATEKDRVRERECIQRDTHLNPVRIYIMK